MTPPAASDPTEHDIRLGAMAQLWVGRALLGCVAVTLLIAIVVASRIPLDTTVVYNRLSNEFRVPIVGLLAIPALLSIMWVRGRKDRSGRIPARERRILLAFGGLFVVAGIVGQLVLAQSYLAAGLGG